MIGECIEEAISYNALLECDVSEGVGRGSIAGAYLPFPAVSAAYRPKALSFGISIFGTMMSVANIDVVEEGMLEELG